MTTTSRRPRLMDTRRWVSLDAAAEPVSLPDVWVDRDTPTLYTAEELEQAILATADLCISSLVQHEPTAEAVKGMLLGRHRGETITAIVRTTGARRHTLRAARNGAIRASHRDPLSL